MSRPTVPPDDMTDDGYYIIQKMHPVKGFYSPSDELKAFPSRPRERAFIGGFMSKAIRIEDQRSSDGEQKPYVPTPEEVHGDSWEYCYAQSTPLPFVPPEEKHEPE